MDEASKENEQADAMVNVPMMMNVHRLILNNSLD